MLLCGSWHVGDHLDVVVLHLFSLFETELNHRYSVILELLQLSSEVS